MLYRRVPGLSLFNVDMYLLIAFLAVLIACSVLYYDIQNASG